MVLIDGKKWFPTDFGLVYVAVRVDPAISILTNFIWSLTYVLNPKKQNGNILCVKSIACIFSLSQLEAAQSTT